MDKETREGLSLIIRMQMKEIGINQVELAKRLGWDSTKLNKLIKCDKRENLVELYSEVMRSIYLDFPACYIAALGRRPALALHPAFKLTFFDHMIRVENRSNGFLDLPSQPAVQALCEQLQILIHKEPNPRRWTRHQRRRIDEATVRAHIEYVPMTSPTFACGSYTQL